MPKVSIIIPIYNVEKYLRQCLDSVVNQTLKDIEIICVNDCSPDNSQDIIDEYAKKDERIKSIILEENGGQGNARNIALDIAQGEYIMYLDPDDWYELDACETAYNHIKKNNNDFVIFNVKDFDENTGEYTERNELLKQFLKMPNTNNINPNDVDEPCINAAWAWYKIYKKDFILKHNLKFLEGRYYEDYAFHIESLFLTENMSIIDKPLYYYRHRNSSITSCSKYWKDFVFSRDNILNNINNFKCSIKLKEFCIIRNIKTFYNYYNKFVKLDKSIKKEFYYAMHLEFKRIKDEYSIENIKNEIDYQKFETIASANNLFLYNLLSFLKNILAFRIVKNHLIISILGIKFSFKFKTSENPCGCRESNKPNGL